MGPLEQVAEYDPDYEYGSLLPFRKNKKTKKAEFATPSILKELARAILAPGRAVHGEIDPFSEQGMMEALNLAGMAQLTGFGSAVATKTGGKGALGSAALINKSKLSDAKTLAEKMYPTISQDGKRLSYPLSSGRIHTYERPQMLDDVARDKLAREYSSLDRQGGNGLSRTFAQIFDELPPGYEDLADLRMRSMAPEHKVWADGMFYPDDNAIGFKNISDILDPKQTVLEHELSHAAFYKNQPTENRVYKMHPEIPKGLQSLVDMDGHDRYIKLRNGGYNQENESPLLKLVMENAMDSRQNARQYWHKRPEEMAADWGAGRSNDYLQKKFKPSINSGPLLNKLSNLTTEEDLLRAIIAESQGGETLYDVSLKSLLDSLK